MDSGRKEMGEAINVETQLNPWWSNCSPVADLPPEQGVDDLNTTDAWHYPCFTPSSAYSTPSDSQFPTTLWEKFGSEHNWDSHGSPGLLQAGCAPPFNWANSDLAELGIATIDSAPKQSGETGKATKLETEQQQQTEPNKQLSRKAQNRAAQQAHRERKKKLITELWVEVHSLRAQNQYLQKQLQIKTDALEDISRRCRGDDSAPS